MFDLHTHTHNSDGLLSPEELLHKAAGLGLRGVVITDHSQVTYDLELRVLAVALNVRLPFPGAEVSTTFEGKKYHLLTYGLGIMDTEFLDYIFKPSRLKNDIYLEVITELGRRGYTLPSTTQMLSGYDPSSGRTRHPNKRLLSNSLISHHLSIYNDVPPDAAKSLVRALYDKWEDPASERYLQTTEVLRHAHDCGALIAVAHPWWECSSKGLSRETIVRDLITFKELGLTGFETASRHYSDSQNEADYELSLRLDLFPFRGSDFHDESRSRLGQFTINDEEMDSLMQIAERGRL